MTQGNLCLEEERYLKVRVPRAFKMMLDARGQAHSCCPQMGSFQISSTLKVLSAMGIQTLNSV